MAGPDPDAARPILEGSRAHHRVRVALLADGRGGAALLHRDHANARGDELIFQNLHFAQHTC
eukprot:7598063-Pyramimonas_sp.AAC.1